jgi:hypothetical protein
VLLKNTPTAGWRNQKFASLINLQIARAYLLVGDPQIGQQTYPGKITSFRAQSGAGGS